MGKDEKIDLLNVLQAGKTYRGGKAKYEVMKTKPLTLHQVQIRATRENHVDKSLC